LIAARRLWWVWASWVVFAIVVQWHRVQLAGHEEAATERDARAVLLHKVCAGEHRVATLAERVCLPCEETQRNWLQVLGVNPDAYTHKRRQGGAVGPLARRRFDAERP